MYMSKLDYIAFFCAVVHTSENEQYLLDTLKNYDIGSYLVVRETALNAHKDTDGQHYHFLVQMSQVDYGRFRKRVFIDHFKLRGQAKGGSRQYGKVNYLKDPNKMAIYMLKDDSVVATTFSDSQLDSWYNQSYKKSEEKGLKEKMVEYVEKHLQPLKHDPDEWVKTPNYDEMSRIHLDICALVVQFYRKEDAGRTLTRAQLINFVNYYMLYRVKELSDRELAWHILSGGK